MSFTLAVPPAVPSVFHSSVPPAESFAAKNSVPFDTVKPNGDPSAAPGRVSLTMKVPAAVPSLRHSS